MPQSGWLRRLSGYRFHIQCSYDSGGDVHVCNLHLCGLADFSDAIRHEYKVEVLSSDANFLGSEVWHMVHFERNRAKDGGLIH